MPRGFQRAIADTEAAYASGRLIDAKRRSFISQPKAIPGECETPQPHLILYGADRSLARMKLFERERSKCQSCHRVVVWGGEDSWEPWVGEMQHVRDKPWNKCDCPANLVLSCRGCHQGPGSKHYERRPRWTVHGERSRRAAQEQAARTPE